MVKIDSKSHVPRGARQGRSPRVLAVTNFYPYPECPYRGIFVRNQVESVKALGLDVEVFSIKGHESRLQYLKAPFRLFRLLRSEAFDLLHAQHTYTLYLTWLVRTLLRQKTPIVLTFRESEFMKPKGMSMDKKGIWARLITSRRMKLRALELADHVIVVWSGLAQDLKFQGPYEEMACGINMRVFHPIPRADARGELGWSTEDRIAFFPADVQRSHEKGADLLEKAVELLKSRGIDLRVEYANNIPHHRMPYYMAAADVVVHPSPFDASPNAVKEAMAVGAVVVTTPVGDVRQVSHDLESVFWVAPDPEDIAEKLELALRVETSLEGRERLEALGLSEESVAERLRRLYLSWGLPANAVSTR